MAKFDFTETKRKLEALKNFFDTNAAETTLGITQAEELAKNLATIKDNDTAAALINRLTPKPAWLGDTAVTPENISNFKNQIIIILTTIKPGLQSINADLISLLDFIDNYNKLAADDEEAVSNTYDAELTAFNNADIPEVPVDKLDIWKDSIVNNINSSLTTLKNSCSKVLRALKTVKVEETNKASQDWKALFLEIGKGADSVLVTDPKVKGGKRKCNDITELVSAFCELELAPKCKGADPKVVAKQGNILGTAFVNELLVLGFTQTTNPFLAFLVNPDKQPLVTFEITAIPYNGLHNAFIKYIISKDDLMGKGEVGLNNLIFDKQLYKLNVGELPIYLTLQANVLSKKEKNENIPAVYAGKDKTADFINSFFYEGGNPLYGKKATSTKLKSIKDLNELYVSCFNETAKEVDIPFRINSFAGLNPIEVKKLMYYLIIRFVNIQTMRDRLASSYGLSPDDFPDYNTSKKWGVVFDSIKLADKKLTDALNELAKLAKIPTAETK